MGAFISMLCSKIGCQDKNMLTEEEPGEAKQYSWDKRKKVDPKDYTIEDLDGQTVGRLPGSIDGQQFIIQKCTNCEIFLYDNIATVSVDDCVNCRIFIGPVKTSAFIRDCTDCQVMLSCQQFRTRDCKKLEVHLSCVSQPIIESSTAIKFGCYKFFYPQLADQFRASGLTVYNNNWSNIHDFTPITEHKNFSLLSETNSVEKFKCNSGIFMNMEFDLSGVRWVVPFTHSKLFSNMTYVVLVVFFRDSTIYERVARFLDAAVSSSLAFDEAGGRPRLVLTKETAVQPADAGNVFNTDAYNGSLQAGAVVALQYAGGVDFTATCRDLATSSYQPCFVSDNSDEAKNQVESLIGFSDMQMGF